MGDCGTTIITFDHKEGEIGILQKFWQPNGAIIVGRVERERKEEEGAW